jgi:hypothetical protein
MKTLIATLALAAFIAVPACTRPAGAAQAQVSQYLSQYCVPQQEDPRIRKLTGSIAGPSAADPPRRRRCSAPVTLIGSRTNSADPGALTRP